MCQKSGKVVKIQRDCAKNAVSLGQCHKGDRDLYEMTTTKKSVAICTKNNETVHHVGFICINSL